MVREFSAAASQYSQAKSELRSIETKLAYGAHKAVCRGEGGGFREVGKKISCVVFVGGPLFVGSFVFFFCYSFLGVLDTCRVSFGSGFPLPTQVRLDRDQQDGLSRATVRVLKCRQAEGR